MQAILEQKEGNYKAELVCVVLEVFVSIQHMEFSVLKLV